VPAPRLFSPKLYPPCFISRRKSFLTPDSRATAKYLDDDVIFFNEGGDKATKAEMSQDGPSVPGMNTHDQDNRL
jgi:hypothetical protein